MNDDGSGWGGAPRVSVVVPIYRRPHAVAAVVATLHDQTFKDWELLFVDDGSPGEVEAAVRPWLDDERIRYLRLDTNRGPSAARNHGIDAARGELVAFLDSDDSWAPEKLECQVALIDAEAGDAPAMCVTLTNIEMPGGWTRVRPDAHPRPGQPFGEYLYCEGGYAQASSFLVTSDLLRTVRFREELRQYEDHLFAIALVESGARYLVVDDALTNRDNRHRPDRLSQRDDLDRGAAFLRAAGPLMTDDARLAFGLRILGPRRLRREPIAVLRDGSRALARGAIDRRALAAMAVNAFAPRALKDVAVRRATRSRGSSKLVVRTGRDYPVSFAVDLGSRDAVVVRGPQAPLKRVVPWGDAIAIVPGRWDLIHTVNAIPVGTRTHFVVSFEDHLPRCPEDRARGQWLDAPLRRRLLSPRCIRILSMSEYGVRVFRRQHRGWDGLGRALDKLEVLPPSVEERGAVPRPAGATLRLCFVGNDFLRKGGPALVRAHQRLRQAGIPVETTVVSTLRWRPDDYVGPPRAAVHAAEVQRLRSSAGIVHIAGAPNAEALRIMDESDFLVLPTLHDTFGFVSLEAMAGGTPVISTATCAQPEIVEHGRSGYLLPFENDELGRWRHLYRTDEDGYVDAYEDTIEALAASIEDRLTRCWDERDGYEHLRAGAIDRVREHFDRGRARERLEAIYDEARR